MLLAQAQQLVNTNDRIIYRAFKLQGAGFSEFDALHLACSEDSAVDVSLTTDDRLLRRAQRGSSDLKLRVMNPLSFREELRNADDQLDDREFQRHALSILGRELGAVGLARFIRLYRAGPGDYTIDRDKWLANLSIDDIVDKIRLM